MSRTLKVKLREIDAKHGVIRLDYKLQVYNIITASFKKNPNLYIFSETFEDVMRNTIDRVNSWLLRLILIQFPLYFYLALASQKLNTDALIFGFKFSSGAEIKASILLISSSMGIASAVLSVSNQHRCAILDAIIKIKRNDEPEDILRYSMSDNFYTVLWKTMNIPDFMHVPETKNKAFTVILGLFALFVIVLALIFIAIVQISIWLDVYNTTGLHWNLPTIALIISLSETIFTVFIHNYFKKKERFLPKPLVDEG